jgi:EAL domain-containing protein (putative c-di-GMP-specific phosphodiesterase class I)
VGLRLLEAGASADDLVRDADLALYAAKALGKDQVVEFSPRLREERIEGSRTIERLRSALADEDLEVWYQPIVALPGGRPAAVEALLRWRSSDGPAVPPDRFIPAAEASGLIVPLGEWAVRQACRDVAAWHREYGTVLSVNVSPLQLREPGFAALVRDGLAEAGLPASALMLEITEGVLMGRGGRADIGIAQLTELRAEGVRIALDDFGTGYSSLAYLRDLPIDALKIDRSFLPSDSADAAQRTPLVRAIVELATALGLSTIAEGVENECQAEQLRELGCQWAQGNRFGAAVAAPEVRALLAGPLADTA